MGRRLLLLLGLGVLAVVLNHSVMYGYQATISWWWRIEPETAVAMGCNIEERPVDCPDYDVIGSPTYWGLTMVRRAIGFGVPAFLLVSGYFIAFASGKNNPRVTWPILRSRLMTLLIPYLLWSSIIFLGQATVYQHGFSSPLVYLRKLLTGGASGSYYYIPMLMQMYLLSPLLVPLSKKRWKGTLLTAGLVQFSLDAVRYVIFLVPEAEWARTVASYTPMWFFPGHIFWFTLGVVLGFHYPAIKPFLQKHIKWLVGGTIFFYIASLVEFELLLNISGRPFFNFLSTYTTSLYAICFMFALIAAKKVKLPFQQNVSALGTKSFGMYLIHEQVMEVAGILIFTFTPVLLRVQVLYQPLLIIPALLVPLLLMALVNRSPLRNYAKRIFG